MKIIKLILSAIIALSVSGFVVNSITPKMTYAQEKPTIEDVVGTWANEEMMWDKWIFFSDMTWEEYVYLDQKLPNDWGTFTIHDSWIDENGNKFFQVHIHDTKWEPGMHVFGIWKINEAGDVLELNQYRDWEYRGEEDDVPEKYPTEIDPNRLGGYYFIYYRQ